MNIIKSKILFILLLSVALPLLGIADYSPRPKFHCMEKTGVEVDIIQGIVDTELLVIGEGCGNMQITILNANGRVQLESFILEGDTINWSFSVQGWNTGTYLIVVDSPTTACNLVREVQVK